MSANLAVLVGSGLMIWGLLGYFGFVDPIKLRSPFVTRSHYEDVVGELRRQIAEKESERQKCWDLLAQMGFGTKVFDTSSHLAGSGQAGNIADDPEDEVAPIKTPEIPTARLRPSQIMRKMDMEKMREYRDKHRLARKAEVLAEVTAILDGKAVA
jgi:hypothetical protein